jgi:hypothetical protein
MSAPALRCGLVVLGRSDPRRLRATLRSVERLQAAPESVAVVAPRAREHLLAELAPSAVPAAITRVIAEAHESPLAAGFKAVAPQVDVAVLLPEGVVLAPGYLATIRDAAARWEDLVGAVDLVRRVVKVDSESGLTGAEVEAGEFPLMPLLRGWLAARSLLASVLWVRVDACGGIDFAVLPDFCDTVAFALYLDRLRPRGRTRMGFTDRAQQVRFVPERRSGFDLGYGVYARLDQLAHASGPDQEPSCIHPRWEQIRLVGGQALRYVLAPKSRQHALTVLQGALAARHEAQATRRAVRRDLREIR